MALLLLAAPSPAQAQDLQDYDYVTNADGATITITGYSGPGGVAAIPAAINGLPVTGIGEDAFFEAGVSSVTIPGSVTSIGEEAFYGCTNLASLTVQDGVTNIGLLAFFGCTSLASLTLPGSVTSFGEVAFGDCYGLTNVYFIGNAPAADSTVFAYDKATVYYLPGATGWSNTFGGIQARALQSPYGFTVNAGETLAITSYTGPGGTVSIPASLIGLPVTGIADDAFLGDASLTNVIIPGSVTNIGEEAFGFCSSLASVTIPGSVTSIGDYAFWNCGSLTNATMAGGVASIGADAFSKCGLTSVTIPASVTNLGSLAFAYCSGLAGANIPGGVTRIGDAPFLGCAGLALMTVDSHNLFYSSTNGVLFDATQSTLIEFPGGLGGSYTIPGTVTNIGADAFYACAGLTGITIPGSVTCIGNEAFGFCTSLAGVRIPPSVSSICAQAFYCCTNLASIAIPGPVASIGDEAFAFCASVTGVYFQGGAPAVDATVFSCDTNATVYYLPGAAGWSNTFAGHPAVLWNPLIQTGGGFGVSGNQFGFNIAGTSNIVIVVEASTNLARPVWTRLQTNTLLNGSCRFSEPLQTNSPGRYYRLSSP